MSADPAPSEFRFEKRRADAVVTLVGGDSVKGCFFLAAGSTRGDGAERIGDLLNSDPGFCPFEIRAGQGPRAVLYNRAQVVSVAIFDDEARRDTGYAVATRRDVIVLMTSGQRIRGAIRVYRPEGRDRVSDWTRQPEIFRYVETGDSGAVIVNAAHIVSVTEVPAP